MGSVVRGIADEATRARSLAINESGSTLARRIRPHSSPQMKPTFPRVALSVSAASTVSALEYAFAAPRTLPRLISAMARSLRRRANTEGRSPQLSFESSYVGPEILSDTVERSRPLRRSHVLPFVHQHEDFSNDRDVPMYGQASQEVPIGENCEIFVETADLARGLRPNQIRRSGRGGIPSPPCLGRCPLT